MWEALLDALLDTVKIIGILYLVYLLVSYFEHHGNDKFNRFLQKSKSYGPFVGSAMGIIPQCGFSAVMADLYSKRKITIGTLLAVFIATSDEAIPILLSHPEYYRSLIFLLAIKFLYAIVIGYVADLVIMASSRKKAKLTQVEDDGEIHDHHHDHCHHDHCGHNHCCADNIFLDALKHTIKIALFIFIATFAINLVVHHVGTESLSNALLSTSIFQPIIAAVIGLIPNCCASVVLIELYVMGGLSFGSLVAGLCAGSGVGLLVLFRKNKPIWQNLLITAICFVSGAGLGMLLCLF